MLLILAHFAICPETFPIAAPLRLAPAFTSRRLSGTFVGAITS
jgi:hypothetical protein